MGISAAALVASSVLPFVLLDSSDSVLQWVNDSAWAPLAMTAFAFTAVIPFVLVAIYAGHAKVLGVLGLVGLVVSLIGAVAYLGLEFDKAFVWPVLAVEAPDLIDFSGPLFRDPVFGFVHLWMGPAFTIGVLLYGVALIRERVFPRAVGVLFLLGLILAAGGISPPFLIRAVGGLLGGSAIMCMAWIVLQRSEDGASAA
jgi:hypothetical protein